MLSHHQRAELKLNWAIITHLHLLFLINQKEAEHILYFGFQGLHLSIPSSHTPILGVGRRVRGKGVLSLVHPTVGPLLAVKAQIYFTALATDHSSQATTIHCAATVAFAGVAKRNVTRGDSDPVVVSHALLAMEFQLAADTLQAAALVTFKRSLVRASTGIALLTHWDGIHPLIYRLALTTHVSVLGRALSCR